MPANLASNDMADEQVPSREQTLLAAILDSAIDFAIIALDPDNKVTLWNSGAEKILGWTAEEMISRSGALIFTAEDRAAGAVEGELTKALAEGRAEDERWHVRQDGSRFWGSGLMMPLKCGMGFLKIMRDQTARRQIEHSLRQSEDRFRTLAEHIPQLVFRSQSFGERTLGSPQWVAFTGLTEVNSLGLGWMDALHPADREMTREAWATAESSGELYVEHRIRRAVDGQYRWFQTRAKQLAEKGEWFGSSTDIDELRRLKERQDVLLKELHHRTGNLLAVVASIARRTAQSSDSIQIFSQRFEDRILALSRVQAQIARVNAPVLELREIVKMELDALGLLETGRAVVEGPNCLLTAKHAETIALAIHELGTNALKHGAFSGEQGRLLVSWRCPPRGEGFFEWLETGVAKAEAVKTAGRGYGRELIEVALPYALGVQTRLDFDEPGTVRCTIALPLASDQLNA